MDTRIESIIGRAIELRPEFERAVKSVGTAPCGVRRSEMLFLTACVGEKEPDQVIESGRAYGQSTVLLSSLFPRSRVVSIERRREGEAADEALRRCRDLPNVCCLFGDARRLMPEMTQRGDVVLIDGPKNLRALRLALKVIRHCRPGAVFIHDAYQGSTLRQGIQRLEPSALFSDSPRFLENFHMLDGNATEELGEASSSCSTALAYLPVRPGFPTWRHGVEVSLFGLFARIRRWKRRRGMS